MRATNGTKVPRYLSPAAAFAAALFLAQPAMVLAQPASSGATKIIEGIGEPAPILDVPAKARTGTVAKPLHSQRVRRHGYAKLARPVLAGVRIWIYRDGVDRGVQLPVSVAGQPVLGGIGAGDLEGGGGVVRVRRS